VSLISSFKLTGLELTWDE